MTTLPTPIPDVTPETAVFWAATAEGKLLLKRCSDCNEVIWYPCVLCPECSSVDTEWIEASGGGTIYSFTLNYRGEGPYREAPYVLAYVELDEGPRVMTNIVTDQPETLVIGSSVRVLFDDTGEGSALYRFAPI